MKKNISLYFDYLFFVLLSILGMMLAVSLFGQTHLTIDAFEIMLSLNPFQGGFTVLNIPPMGEIKAATHWLPFQIEITFLNVDLDMLFQNIELQDINKWEEELYAEARWAIAWFVFRNLLFSFLGGTVTVYFLGTARIKKHFCKGGIFSTSLLILIFLITIVIPFDLDAFENPQYHGILSAAPWALSIFNDGLVAMESLSQQLQYMATNFAYLFDSMEQLTPRETESNLKVLHVSDIHNNPAAIDFIAKAVHVFDLDMVIDTGDITDYGTPLEADLVSRVAELDVPYVFIPGNHDSPEVVEHLSNKGVIVLDNEIKEINGLNIAGITDPAAESKETVIVEDRKEVEKYATSMKSLLEDTEKELDILAVHDPLIGGILSDYAPVVLQGHTHQATTERKKDTIFINAGTTGASGIRGLESTEDPYSMFILYFNKSDKEKFYLSAADFISVPQIPGGFNLERIYFDYERSTN